jgi:hypothetical protein
MPHLSEQDRKKAGLIALGLFVLLAGTVFVLLKTVGAEVGEPCQQGALACRMSQGFNSNRCLHTSPEAGYCTYTCEKHEECPSDWPCGFATWQEGDREGRTERVCLRP